MPETRRVDTYEIAVIRNRGLRLPSCGSSFEVHEWVRAQAGQTVLVVLCAICGRYPVELLATMVIVGDERAN
jgi:hypothetical protein